MTDAIGEDYYASNLLVDDWSAMVSFIPNGYYRPTSVEQLRVVLDAVIADPANNGRLRILGGQHSCSDIFKADIVIDTAGLPLEFTVDGRQVIASAWMHAHEFTRRASEHGLSLRALGGTDAQTLAGLISTNTAAATVNATVYDTVDWIEYLAPNASGHFMPLMAKRGDPAFLALVCSLGAVGVLTRVGFTLVDELRFSAGFELQPNAVLGNVRQLCADHDFWRIEWLNDSEKMGLLWHADLDPAAPADGDYPEDAMEAGLLQAMKQDEETNRNGPFTNQYLQDLIDGMVNSYVPVTASGPMRNMIPVDRNAQLRCAMAEWSFNPVDIEKVLGVCTTYFNANKWPNLGIEIECTKTDDYLMSPWRWPGLPYIVKFNFQYLTVFLSDTEKAEIATHLEGLWNALRAANVPFKAHWGKINFLTPADVEQLYKWDDFRPFVHPALVNPYLAARFGELK